MKKKNNKISKDKIIEILYELEDQQLIKFDIQFYEIFPELSFKDYFFSLRNVLWFWMIILISLFMVMILFVVPPFLPTGYIRFFLSLLFVLYLPGYVLIKTLFPIGFAFKTYSENLETIERFALSVGLSLAVIPAVGLVLNFTPFGIHIESITVSLLILVVVFGVVAVLREYRERELLYYRKVRKNMAYFKS